MSVAALLPLLLTAFLAGLLGAGHCFGMCAGIAGGLGALSAGRQAWWSAWIFNLSRIASYALLGGAAALLIGSTAAALAVPAWGQWLRVVTALLIAMLGLQFLFSWGGLAVIERAGAGLWQKIAPLARRAAQHPGPGGRALLGLCWGFLPCGLVYTVLITAASTGDFVSGFLTMLAFGLGTLPALLGLTLWAPALAGVLQDRAFRRLAGLALLLLALWTLWMFLPGLLSGNGAHHQHH